MNRIALNAVFCIFLSLCMGMVNLSFAANSNSFSEQLEQAIQNNQTEAVSGLLAGASQTELQSITPDEYSSGTMLNALNQLSSTNQNAFTSVVSSMGASQYNAFVENMTKNDAQPQLLSQILALGTSTQLASLTPDQFSSGTMLSAMTQLSSANQKAFSTVVQNLNPSQFSSLVNNMNKNNAQPQLLSQILALSSPRQLNSLTSDQFSSGLMLNAMTQLSSANQQAFSTVVQNLNPSQFSSLVNNMTKNDAQPQLLSQMLSLASSQQVQSLSPDSFSSGMMLNAVTQLSTTNPKAFSTFIQNTNSSQYSSLIDNFTKNNAPPSLISQTLTSSSQLQVQSINSDAFSSGNMLTAFTQLQGKPLDQLVSELSAGQFNSLLANAQKNDPNWVNTLNQARGNSSQSAAPAPTAPNVQQHEQDLLDEAGQIQQHEMQNQLKSPAVPEAPTAPKM